MPVTTPIDWAILRNVIYDWFAESTNLSGQWARQDQPQLPYPYFSLNLISSRRLGGRDDVINATIGIGATSQAQLTHQGPRIFTVSCQIHTGQKKDQFGTRQEPVPNCDSRSLMESAEMALELQTTKKTFKSCALAFVRVAGDVLDLDLEIDGVFIRRSQMDVEFGTTARVIELETFIEDVTITGTFLSPGLPDIVEDFSIDTDP